MFVQWQPLDPSLMVQYQLGMRRTDHVRTYGGLENEGLKRPIVVVHILVVTSTDQFSRSFWHELDSSTNLEEENSDSQIEA